MDQNEYAALLDEVSASPTMARLGNLAVKAKELFDMCEPEQLKSVAAINAIEVIRSIDIGRIKLEDPRDFVALHRLLWAAMEVVHDGRFGSCETTRQIRLQ